MASQRIQGLSIKLSADTSAIDSALKDLNKNINNTQRELKDVDRLLKYDPKNITLLTQKQGLLTDAINNTKKKLEELTKAQELAQKENLQEKNVKAWNELEKQIEATKQKLKDFEKQSKDVGNTLSDASSGIGTFKDTLNALLTSEAIKTGLNIIKKGIEAIWNGVKKLASGLVDLVKTGVEYNATMETFNVSIKAMLNDDQKATDKLIKSMKNLGAISGYSNETLLEGARNLLSADISAEKTTSTIEGLARAIAYVGGSNDDLSRMITNLQGISSTGKATAQDIKQFKNIGLNVSKLIADQLGKTTEEVENAGITFDMLSEAFIRASEEGGKFASAFEVQTETFQMQTNKLSSNWQQLLGNFTQDTTSAISQSILPSINNLLESMNKAYEEAISKGEYFDEFIDAKGGNLIDNLNNVEVNGIRAMTNAFTEGLSEVIYTLSDSGVLEEILSGASDIINTIAVAFEDEDNREALRKATKSLIDVINQFIQINYEYIKLIGKNLAQPIIDGFWEAIKESIFDSDIYGGYGSYAEMRRATSSSGYGDTIHSLGYGGIASGGFSSGGITLNASFNMANTQLNETSAKYLADLMADEINNKLGGMM